MTAPIDSFQGEYRFLSNFASAKVEYCGYEYSSAEHAYQAAKSLDPAVRREILAAKSASITKRMGKTIQLRPHWDRIKWAILFDIVWTKFHRNPHLAKRLKETGDAELIEGNNWHDNFWGNCTCGRPECADHGKNGLGMILMYVRESLP